MKSEKKGFIIGLIIHSFFICLFTFLIIVMLCLWHTPDISTLKKEDCSFVSYKVIYYGKRNLQKKCYIYVEEYDQPLIIDQDVFDIKYIERLSSLAKGDIITVSIKHEGNKNSLFLVETDDKKIFSYEEYEYEVHKGSQIGLIFFSFFNIISISFLIVEIIHYRKKGECFFLNYATL